MKKTIMIIIGLITLMSFNVVAFDNYCRVFNGGGNFCYNDTGLAWTSLTEYPTICPSGQYVSGLGDTLTCSTPSGGASLTGYFNNIGNFTGTLTNNKYCTYNSGTNEINCNSEGGSMSYWNQTGENLFTSDTSNDVLIGGGYGSTGITLYQNGNVSIDGSLLLGGSLLSVNTYDLIPASNNTYDLGSSSYEWKDLYLRGNITNTNCIIFSSGAKMGVC